MYRGGAAQKGRGETEPTLPHQIGMHRAAFSVDNLDEALEIAARPLRGVANHQDDYTLTYVRGPVASS